MRWKISHDGHDPRQIDLLAVIVLVITIAAAWFYFAHRSPDDEHRGLHRAEPKRAVVTKNQRPNQRKPRCAGGGGFGFFGRAGGGGGVSADEVVSTGAAPSFGSRTDSSTFELLVRQR